MTVEVRMARIEDARGLAEVHVRTWRAAYVGLLPQRTLDRLDVEARTLAWARMVSSGDPTWVAVDGPRVLGFASIGEARDPDAPHDLELRSLYLAPEHHGSGIADALVDAAIGDDPAYLWVLDGNARAIRFYEKRGFALDGVEKVVTARDGTPMREHRMSRP